MAAKKPARPRQAGRIRFAVVGLGHIAQAAVLPAFKHARKAELTALVSDDPTKLRLLGRKYRVGGLFNYDEYDALLRSGVIDAVYLCLPNHLHRDYAVRALQAGIHVLCEKPLAVTAEDCEEMIAAADKHQALLMTAYRLDFDAATLKALAQVKKGFVGRPGLLHASLSHRVKADNVRRLPHAQGGGPLYDLGLYCINAARTFFSSEPLEVSAEMHSLPQDEALGVETSVVGLMRFPEGQLATFECSNGTERMDELGLVGPKGKLHIDHSFEYAGARTITLVRGDRKRTIKVPRSDQFAAELLHFSDCILRRSQPQPSGREGLADVRVIEALYRSAQTHQPVALPPFQVSRRPDPGQALSLPPVGEVKLVHVQPPAQG